MTTKRQPSKRNTKRAARNVPVFDAVLRVSQQQGREGDAFHSPAIQLETCEHGAKRAGGRIGRVFDESNSVSGSTTDRELLNEAMARALSGESDGIIVAAVDRFARSMPEGVAAIKKLQAAGSRFIACDYNIDTGAEDQGSRAASNLMLGFMFLLAEWQRESLIDKWEATRVRHIQHLGITTHAPFGYRKGADRKLVAHDTEAPVVLDVFERRAMGQGWSSIAAALNDEGVRTRNGKAFTAPRIVDIVNRRTYLGEVSSGHDIVNPNAHPAIITNELWERAHARKGKRSTVVDGNATINDYLLTGVLRCASCGGGMVPHSVSAGRALRYRCRINYGWGKCNAPASVKAADVEAIAIKALHKDALSKLSAVGADATDALDIARASLDAANAVLMRWTTDLSNDVLREQAPEAYDAGTLVRTEAVAKARAAVERESNVAGVRATLPDDLGETWATLTRDDQRTWLSSWFAVIAVAPASGTRGNDVSGRVRLFTVDDDDCPGGFLVTEHGNDGCGNRRVNVKRPIDIGAARRVA